MIFGRQQAAGLFQPAADRQRDRADVAVDREEPLAHVLAGRDEAAIAGTDGIDEDEIGKVEPGLGVGLQIGRRRGNRRVAVDGKPPGSGGAELQIGGGRARPAIEEEGHGPGRRVGAIQLIGGVGDIGLRLALVVEQADRTGGGRESQRAPGKRQGLLGGGIRRQTMLLGRGRRSRAGGAPACSARLLTRRRRRGLRLVRRSRILGARAGDQGERKQRDGEADMTRRGEMVGHVCSSPASRNPPGISRIGAGL